VNPSASSSPQPCLVALHTGLAVTLTGADRIGHGMGPSSPRVCRRSAVHPRFEALLLLEIRSRRRRVVLPVDGRCSPGLLPLQSFRPSRARSGNFPSSCAPPGTAHADCGSGATLLSRPSPSGRQADRPAGPQSLGRREDWLVPLGTAGSLGVSHLLGVSRQLGFDTTLDYRFSSGETPRYRCA
jgi:hypothetical protein